MLPFSCINLKKGLIKIKKKLKQLVAIILVLATLFTTGPITAFANTASNQIEIKNGQTYVQKVYPVYRPGDSGGYQQMYSYNKKYANNNHGGQQNPLTEQVDQKYIAPNGSNKKDWATTEDVPIYRVSRSNGWSQDTSAYTVSTQITNRPDELIAGAAGDGITLSFTQADMILAVLKYGCKQPVNANGGNLSSAYYDYQLYYLATQVIIWEIF